MPSFSPDVVNGARVNALRREGGGPLSRLGRPGGPNMQTGGGLPPSSVPPPRLMTGGGLPPTSVPTLRTGGGMPPTSGGQMATGGGLPPSQAPWQPPVPPERGGNGGRLWEQAYGRPPGVRPPGGPPMMMNPQWTPPPGSTGGVAPGLPPLGPGYGIPPGYTNGGWAPFPGGMPGGGGNPYDYRGNIPRPTTPPGGTTPPGYVVS